MVKGISRQVIMVHSPDPKLFDQAIFILKDDAVREGVTEDVLLKEARAAISQGPSKWKGRARACLWAALGACLMGMIWAAVWLL